MKTQQMMIPLLRPGESQEGVGRKKTADDDPFMDDDCLWQPFSELELCLDSERLARLMI